MLDPYNGLLSSPYNWVGCHPLYTLNNQGPFFIAHLGYIPETNLEPEHVPLLRIIPGLVSA